ncbi:hypothetical protein HN51_028178 [Arachis hypogaea]|uniref:Myb/SANT-like domain-containing protein n=1 Tax=Arachis hypogaea TaxID=3818 RepID=A0A445BJV2_ARAHY|nr:hypothetical protein Ahy_A09g044312 [Arachis hypogaea]
MPNKGIKTREANQPSKDNLRWSNDMDEVILNALAVEALKGNKHDGLWITEAYANVVKTLSIVMGLHITKNHIKNRMKMLKDHFSMAYDLFHHLSGFAYNPLTRKFEAKEEVWQDFIKYEKVTLGITTMADDVKEDNYLSIKLHDVAEQQVAMAQWQV